MIDISTAQDEILKLVRTSQDTVVDALQAWTTTVQSVTPSFPKLNLPYVDQLPKPETLVNGAYDFAEQLLSAQRKFANDVLQVAAPLTAQRDDA
ncbi:MAG TPA: hypothetical protein VGS06_04705 [Streptosporangiaceae bacterium]|nr:hypothetical protein [Streptosporangiaceae bacterium]